MIVIDIKRVPIICLSVATLNAIGQDGIILPMHEHGNSSSRCASIKFVLAKDDLTLPNTMTVYKPQSDFVATGKVACASVQTSGKIIIENNTDWLYVFGRQCMRTGYDSLEFDMMMEAYRRSGRPLILFYKKQDLEKFRSRGTAGGGLTDQLDKHLRTVLPYGMQRCFDVMFHGFTTDAVNLRNFWIQILCERPRQFSLVENYKDSLGRVEEARAVGARP